MFRYLILTLTFLTLAHPLYASQPTFEEQHTLITAPRSVVMVEPNATCTQKLAYSCAKFGYCCDYKQPFCSTDGVISDDNTELLEMAGGGAFVGGTTVGILGFMGELTIWGNNIVLTALQCTSVGCCGCGCILCTTAFCIGSRKYCAKEWSNGIGGGGECLPGCITKKCCPTYAKEYERVYLELKGSHKPAVLYMND